MKRSSLLMFLVCALTLLFGVAPLVQADWDPGDSHKMHYPQLPMIDGGWDVCLCCQWVADDFVCSETGPITDIHFWVSFKEDMEFPLNDPAMWDITIRDDAGGMPGAIRWAFSGGKIVTRLYGGGAQGWLCPSPPPLAIPPFPIPDHQDVYQVNITDLLEPMIQQQDTTYWLVIRANLTWMPPPSVGWKQATSAHQYPAMYDFGTGWMPIYMATPDTQDIYDLAFVITGNPIEEGLKFQQAPQDGPYYWGHDELSTAYTANPDMPFIYRGCYMADDFADLKSTPVVNVKWWGSYLEGEMWPVPPVTRFLIAFESDVPAVGQPGDPGYEPSHPGQVIQSEIVTRAAGTVLNPGEFSETNVSVGGPPCYEALFKYEAKLMNPFPQEPDTVYWIKIVALVDCDPMILQILQQHGIMPCDLGKIPWQDLIMMCPELQMFPPLTRWGWHNRDYTIRDPYASTPPGVNPGEHIAGMVMYPDSMPRDVWHFQDDAVSGEVFVDTMDPIMPFVDQPSWIEQHYVFWHPLCPSMVEGVDGPIEIDMYSKDLAFELWTVGEEPEELDFGDAPENTATGGPTQYPTKLVNDGARHVADGVNYLGQLEDVEPDGQPTLAADGDDINPVAADDEDGVTFVNGGLTAGVGEPVDVFVSPVGLWGGYLNVWIDFNADLDWDDAGEYVFVDLPVAGGINNLTITAPAGAVVGPTYARFRYTTYPIAGILGYSGQASDGEIEDYRVVIREEPEEEYTKWIQRPHGPEQGFDEQSNIWIHEDIPAMEVNKVVADDFVSDGRVIKKVRWWGSYFDDRYEPFINPIEPWVVDGWIISFHHTQGIDGTNLACPPDIMAGSVHPTALGLYFAPAYAVEIMLMGYWDCHGHNVYGYKVDLSQCCLICQEVDPRSGTVPAQIGAFCEEECFRYWLDIVAVVGATWEPIAGVDDCDMIYTGHLPSDMAADGRFWGWHTSPDACLKQACSGQIVDMTPPTPNCWDYGNWSKVMWQCPTPVQPPVNMSFELITPEEEPATCFVGTQAEFAVWCGWGQPANWCGDCWRQGDIDGNCAITFADVQMVYGDFLNPTSPGALTGRSDNDMNGAITFADVQKVYGAFLPPTVLCPVPCTPLP